jgi:hypothetical protein
MRMKYFFLTVFLCSGAFAGTVEISPFPLVGNNGVLGWGFTLINDTSSYLSVDSVQLANLVDDLDRFGPDSNFTELFATYQFYAPTILIGPNSTYHMDYDSAGQGLAVWNFPDGLPTFGGVTSNVFVIEVGYSLYDDDGYATATLDANGDAIAGTFQAAAQLQYGSAVPEPASWLLTAPLAAVSLAVRSRKRRAQ